MSVAPKSGTTRPSGELSAARWEQLAAAFEEALPLGHAERAGFLDRACAGDSWARREVDAMLDAHERSTPLGIEHRLLGTGPTPATERESSLAPGTRVGAYRIDALINEGGMGEVYRGERVDGEYRQTVALKVLRASVRSSDLVRRFQVERQILARLVHPDIAPILDGGATADGRPYLVMQYIDGLPITEYCARSGLSLEARLALVRRVAEAVQYAHSRLVVHRDLKPSNILVTREGEPRLLDFGIAKLLGTEEGDAPDVTTRAELRLLTPEYAAPEQIRGEPVTTATDVYALGVLLFELLTGERPARPKGRGLASVERAIVEEPTRPPSSVVAGRAEGRRLRGDLDRIVLMALRKEPERRYGSAGQLAEDLERHRSGLPVRAQRDTVWYRTRKFAARNRVLVGTGAVVTAMLAALTVSTSLQTRRVTRERDRAEQESRLAESVIGMLTGLFERANPTLVPGGDTVRVAALLDEGERKVDSLKEQPALQARMWRVLGNLHSSRARYPRAEELLRRSYEAQRVLGERKPGDLAWTYHELARVVALARGYEVARPMFDSSMVWLRRDLEPDDTELETALVDFADATPDLERRRALLDSLIARQQARGADPFQIAATFNALGGERYGRGHSAEAVGMFEQSLKLLDQKLPLTHPNRITVLYNLASAFGQMGDWQRGEPLIREATRLHRQAAAPDTTALANTLENWAMMRASHGELAQAEDTLRESLRMIRNVLAPGHWRIARTLRNLGLVAAARGRTAAGLALLDSAVAIERVRVGPDGQETGYAMGERVLLLLRLGRTAEAMSAARTADRILRATTAVGHERRALGDFWVAAAAYAQGDPLTAQARFDSARVQLAGFLMPTDRRLAMVECGEGAALAALKRQPEALPYLRRGCPIYERWGRADPLLVAWGRAARKRGD